MTGKRRETVAMALTYDPETREAVVCSAWGPDTEWTRNLRAHPALEIQVGRERYVPEQRFLSADDAVVEGSPVKRSDAELGRVCRELSGELGGPGRVCDSTRSRSCLMIREFPDPQIARLGYCQPGRTASGRVACAGRPGGGR
jgi:hypothetical protein